MNWITAINVKIYYKNNLDLIDIWLGAIWNTTISFKLKVLSIYMVYECIPELSKQTWSWDQKKMMV